MYNNKAFPAVLIDFSLEKMEVGGYLHGDMMQWLYIYCKAKTVIASWQKGLLQRNVPSRLEIHCVQPGLAVRAFRVAMPSHIVPPMCIHPGLQGCTRFHLTGSHNNRSLSSWEPIS